jgi:hypothetical protein
MGSQTLVEHGMLNLGHMISACTALRDTFQLVDTRHTQCTHDVYKHKGVLSSFFLFPFFR